MTGPKPSAPPKPRPSQPPRPRLGEQIRDAEHYLHQALAVLRRDVDPATVPTALLWDLVPAYDALRSGAVTDVLEALSRLAHIAELPAPPVGSAVPVPAAATYGLGAAPRPAPAASGEAGGGSPGPLGSRPGAGAPASP